MHANFKVDPRLASLLGENYRSTELAIKELIDNSYDADAENVWVTLPKPLTDDPIVIRDDGTGMTESEVRNEYLNIASSRVSRKGERTRLKNRLVKGRKGIGKFAGLMVASLMELHTRTRGKETQLKILRDELIKARNDLEQINLPVAITEVDEHISGTEIILRGINQNFTFPNADKLKRLLILEYGRMGDFRIYVDGELIDIEDIPGDIFEEDISLSNGDVAKLRYTISDGKSSLKQSGLAFRVGGKIVGSPQFFGLEETDDIPQKLLRRVYGEIIADSLEADVTADWGSIIANSKLLHELKDKVRPVLEESFGNVYQREVDAAKVRLRRRINGSMDRIPTYKKEQAHVIMEKVIRKFFGESETRQVAVFSLLLDAFQQNDYSPVMQKLEASRESKIEEITDVFSEFGLLDVALLAQQSQQRLKVLHDFEHLILNPETEPQQIHRVISN
ncbi:MAG: ATP-binding protein, partial [Bacteroidota bacterium]